MQLDNWPNLTDDTGNLTSGTPHTKAAVYDPIKAAIEDVVHSEANPEESPAGIIDEVVAARGNMGSLNARISNVIDDDGNLTSEATGGAVTTVEVQTVLGSTNLLGNDTFLLWPLGDAAAPSYFALTGAGAAVARTGSGLADTSRKVGKYAAKVTYGSATAKLIQVLLDDAIIGDADHLEGTKFGFGCWVKCATNAIARITLDDGVASPSSSDYHTGTGLWQWLSGTHTIRAGMTYLQLHLVVEGAGSAFFSGPTVVMADVAPSRHIPTPKVYGSIQFKYRGALVVSTRFDYFAPSRPGLVKDVQMALGTAPTTTALTVDVNSWDGAALTSMFTTKPTIAAGATRGGGQPDGTYARRCLSGTYGAGTPVAGGEVTADVDSFGGAPADLDVSIRVMQYARPLEDFMAYND